MGYSGPANVFVGNVCTDISYKRTDAGRSVVNFNLAAITGGRLDQQTGQRHQENLFIRCTAWGNMAENIAQSLCKGMRVVVVGRMRTSNYQDKHGVERSGVEMIIDDLGPSLMWATATVERQQNGRATHYQTPPPHHSQKYHEPHSTRYQHSTPVFSDEPPQHHPHTYEPGNYDQGMPSQPPQQFGPHSYTLSQDTNYDHPYTPGDHTNEQWGFDRYTVAETKLDTPYS